MANKLIILDRDGVINLDSDLYIKSAEEWIPIESSLLAISRLNKANYKVAIATNQSGISRGYFNEKNLAEMHQKMFFLLAEYDAHIDAIEFCSDHPDNPTQNRKPNPGMLNNLIQQFEVNPQDCWFVGDSKSDIQCALNARCKPALVLTGKGRKTLESGIENNIPVFDDLNDFVDFILTS